MFDLGRWGEFLIIAMAALILLGPKELPEIMRAWGRWLYKIRKLSAQVSRYLDNLAHEGQIDEYERSARLKSNKTSYSSSSAQTSSPESVPATIDEIHHKFDREELVKPSLDPKSQRRKSKDIKHDV